MFELWREPSLIKPLEGKTFHAKASIYISIIRKMERGRISRDVVCLIGKCTVLAAIGEKIRFHQSFQSWKREHGLSPAKEEIEIPQSVRNVIDAYGSIEFTIVERNMSNVCGFPKELCSKLAFICLVRKSGKSVALHCNIFSQSLESFKVVLEYVLSSFVR